jgi:hypothetical protein
MKYSDTDIMRGFKFKDGHLDYDIFEVKEVYGDGQAYIDCDDSGTLLPTTVRFLVNMLNQGRYTEIKKKEVDAYEIF